MATPDRERFASISEFYARIHHAVRFVGLEANRAAFVDSLRKGLGRKLVLADVRRDAVEAHERMGAAAAAARQGLLALRQELRRSRVQAWGVHTEAEWIAQRFHHQRAKIGEPLWAVDLDAFAVYLKQVERRARRAADQERRVRGPRQRGRPRDVLADTLARWIATEYATHLKKTPTSVKRRETGSSSRRTPFDGVCDAFETLLLTMNRPESISETARQRAVAQASTSASAGRKSAVAAN